MIAFQQFTLANGLKVLLVGSSKRPAALPNDCDLREVTSPLDLAGAISHCVLHIGHDSFPLHVAQSQGVPVVGLFGTTRANLILTNGSPAEGIDGQSPCAGERHRVAGVTFSGCEGACMRDIRVEQVQEAVSRMLLRTQQETTL